MSMVNYFMSHGSPMNAIANNNYTKSVAKEGEKYKPSAIVVVSAHWHTNGVTKVQSDLENKVIYDFGGFPRELYEVQYPTSGSAEVAQKIKQQIPQVEITKEWGLDHGAWSVLKHMYPKGDIPIVQLSINRHFSIQQHYEMGKKLSFLNDENVMIIGSGNVSHNLSLVDFYEESVEPNTQWTKDLNEATNEAIKNNHLNDLVNYKNLPGSQYGIATNDHYIPLLYVLGASHNKKNKEWFYKGYELGTLSMDCIKFF